jgi:hypothetical protein
MVHIRVGGLDGRLYLDLGDETWRAVEIDPNGWRAIDNPPVRFRRAAGMKPLPIPVKGGSIETLRSFLNVQSDADFVTSCSRASRVRRSRPSRRSCGCCSIRTPRHCGRCRARIAKCIGILLAGKSLHVAFSSLVSIIDNPSMALFAGRCFPNALSDGHCVTLCFTHRTVAPFVGLSVVADTLLAVGFARNDGPYFLLVEEGAKRIRVITFVGRKLLDARDQADAFLRHDTVGGVARRQDQHPRAEKFIDDRVDFAVAAALGTAVSLDMTAIQRGLFRRPGRSGNRLEYPPPNSPLAPAGKAIVDRLVGAVPKIAAEREILAVAYAPSTLKRQLLILFIRTVDYHQIIAYRTAPDSISAGGQ